jgi:septum formation protein
MPKIILASQSPRRIELLRQITTRFEVIPSAIEEIIDPQRTPLENAVDLAVQKAQWVARKHKGRLVLGADTLVVLDGDVIGKPADRNDALRILRRLSGREHQVITGVAIVNDSIFKDAAVSTVCVKPLTDEEISRYVDTGEPMDKAGAYAIQGEGAFMVSRYQGSFTNIVGLPVETVRDLLRKSGYCLD